ncbi:MAG TPA: hypothetical protein VJ725_18905 [Thermoanaerobaculia bacterium]|nr:hypothetical protein [Thermoanaerobaculia bacterium]
MTSRKSFLLNFHSFLSLGLLIALGVGAGAPAAAGQGRWTPVGPGKGRFDHAIVSVVPDPVEPGSVWAGFPLGGLYRSTDHGKTWRWAGRPFAGNGLRAVAADPSTAGALWVATRTGLFHTADQGNHWSLIAGAAYTAALQGDDSLELTAVSGSPTAFYVRTARRIVASFDSGQSWQTVFDSGEVDTILEQAIVPATPPALYVRTAGPVGWGLFASLDGGRTWKPLTSCPALAAGIQRIAASRDAFYVLPVQDTLGLLRSRDGGTTWQSVLGNRPEQPFLLIDVTVDPESSRTVWALGGPRGEVQDDITLWVSRDGGNRWRKRNLPPFLPDLVIGSDALYAFTREQLAQSLDGGWTWSSVFRLPADESPPARLSFQAGDPSHMTFVVGHQIFRSEDGSRSWRQMIEAPAGINDVWTDPARPGRKIAVGGDVLLSTDDGRSWTRTSASLYAELLVSAGGRTLFAGGCGVYRSRNAGKTWQEVLPCSSRHGPKGGRYVQKMEVDPAHPQEVYALTFLDRDFYPNHGPLNGLPSLLWRSRDGGATWKQIATEIDAFALDRSHSRLYASRELDLLVSDDGGDTWRSLPQMPAPVTDLAAPAGLPDTLYAAANPALRRSRDGGRTWETFDQGIPPGRYLLTVHPVDGRTVYALSREGLFHMTLP